MNRKGLVCAGLFAVICGTAFVTLATWPPTDSVTWQPSRLLHWWQFEWLAAVGFTLSALPSFVIFKLDAFFAANESLRNPVAALLVFLEVAAIAWLIYKVVSVLDARGKAQQALAADARKPSRG
jgi:hypothetical protein